MIRGAPFGPRGSKAATTASLGLILAVLLFGVAYVASNLSDGSLELTRQAAFRFSVFAAIAGIVSLASLYLIAALINLVFRSVFAVTVTIAAPAVEADGAGAPPQTNVLDDDFLLQSRYVESAIMLTGLILIFVPLSFVALRSLADEYARAPKSFSQPLTLPPAGAAYAARLTVPDHIDVGESVPASLSIERVASAGPATEPARGAGTYGAQVVAPNLAPTTVSAPMFPSLSEHPRWSWTIGSRVAGKDAPALTGREAISTVIVTYSGDGHLVDRILGPAASITVREPFTWTGVLAGIAPVLSFVLGLGTLIVGFTKRGREGTADPAKI